MTQAILNRESVNKGHRIEQEPLPYAENALSPYIKAKTLKTHYGKHHRAYIDKVNALIDGTDFEVLSLEEIIRATVGREEHKVLFNNAAQAWNHWFYWRSMKPKGGGRPGRLLSDLLKRSYGSFSDFKEIFLQSAKTHFGSGWIWLVKENNQIKVVETHDADTPIAHGSIPLLTLDIWEHAYYLDYQNKRAEYSQAFFEHLINWDFAESRLVLGRLDS